MNEKPIEDILWDEDDANRAEIISEVLRKHRKTPPILLDDGEDEVKVAVVPPEPKPIQP